MDLPNDDKKTAKKPQASNLTPSPQPADRPIQLLTDGVSDTVEQGRQELKIDKQISKIDETWVGLQLEYTPFGQTGVYVIDELCLGAVYEALVLRQPAELRRISALEIFDDPDQFALIMSHYCLVFAASGACVPLVGACSGG